ncbi:MAG TPA: cell division protein ZapE [Xanthobacteraceae bacterium]|jgi:cell division protein ZapE|nr:cell division protein ZapE [Xanthobacteraceae bacterium]
MPADLTAQYAALVATGEIERDRAQEAVLERLSLLERRLAHHRLARKSSSLGWLFGARERREAPIRGLYIFGEVGRGKTMLMDLFFAASPVARKRRAHFHEFMADTHERIANFRRQQKNGVGTDEDPIRLTAAAIADESWLLCFDEFNVTDIADAMILGRMFRRLFELGVVVVATSNVAPGELYRDGLNRALFLPFIGLIEHHMEVVELSARADFRLEKLAGQPVWHVPADAAATAALDEAWRRLTGGQPGAAQDLVVLGRVLHIPRAAKGVVRFGFDELCEQPLGAADYLKIAHEFHTLILDRIPVMDFDRRDEAKRFIILIDTLYENAVKLLASAAAEPDALYRAEDGFEVREFKRAASRLIEMRSQSYLALPHGRRDSAASPSTQGGIVET